MNNEQRQNPMESNDDVMEFITQLALDEDREAAFFVADLSDVLMKIQTWKRELPFIRPFYAVKCNPESRVLRLMASMSVGFDCASKNEIDSVLSAGARPSDIIYAHPYKSVPFLRHARMVGVDLMTFDSPSELYKIKVHYPNARLLLRFRLTNIKAGFPLNNKFGCPPMECRHLLQIARKLDLDVVGTCFHVGSLCQEPEAYGRAIQTARYVFDVAEELGFQFSLLDIGGGYPGHTGSNPIFLEMCSQIRQALDKFFPERAGLKVVAEPGCFLMCSAFSLCATVIGKKKVLADQDDDDENSSSGIEIMYYLNDSVYLSFPEGIDMYHLRTIPLLKDDQLDGREVMCSKLWGCTCCSTDCIMKKCLLPEMELGEQIVFQNMGAYTLNFATDFNCFPKPPVYYTSTANYRSDVSRDLENPFYNSQLTKRQAHHLNGDDRQMTQFFRVK